VLSNREASIFACVCDTVVAPEPSLPPVADTDAVAFFERLVAASPPLNGLGLRALLYAAEIGPRALGAGKRLRQLSPSARALVLARAESSRLRPVRRLAAAVKSVAFLSYYGDRSVLERLGYDPDMRVERGRSLRAKDGWR
jgi:hypothetical protein